MTHYLLDTNILIDYFKGFPKVEQFVDQLIDDMVAHISIVTLAEIRVGWSDEQEANLYPKITTLFPVETLTEQDALTVGAFRRKYRTKGKELSLADMFIAAIAYDRQWCLVTRNSKDFPMPEVQRYRDIEMLYS